MDAPLDRAAAAKARSESPRATPLGRWLVVGMIAANAVVATLAVAWLAQSYRHQLETTAVYAQTVSRLVGDRLVASFDRMDLGLQEIQDDAHRASAAGKLDGKEIESILALQRSRTPDALFLRVTDADGWVRWSAPLVPLPVNVSDRDYFAPLARDPKAGLFVSGPFHSRILKRPVLVLARRLSRADGTFAGVITGSIELSRLSEILAAVRVGPDVVVTLRRTDLSLVAANHPLGAPVGSRDDASAALRAHLEAGHESGTYDAVGPVDGRRRIQAFAKLAGYPLCVVVAVGREEALRDWRRLLAGVVALLACFSAGSVGAVVAERRALRRRLEYERLLVEQSEQLLETEERFRTAFETSPDAISVSRVEGGFLMVNDGFRRLTGWSEADAVGRTALELALWEDEGDRERFVRELETRGAVVNFEAHLRRRTGELVDCLLSARLFTLRGERLILILNRDIGDWKKAEAERDRLREQVQQSQKLESIGQLAGGVAHDFNNLLTVVLSCSEALRDDLAAGGAGDPELVEEIAAAGERARDLTRQLLAFARKQVSTPERLDVSEVVRRSEKLLRRTLREDIALAVALEPEPWPVWCDPVQLEQILLNLCVNGRDAMPEGGILRIETRNLPAGEGPSAGAGGREAEDAVLLAVQDTGVGMTPEVQAHLFEPFFTTKAQGKGTGLGLATVHGIVTQSGGRIRVETAPGRGTRFEVRLPRTQRGARATAAARAERRSGSETVLVVEDDPAVRAVTVRSLEGAGYRVLVASRASEALELARGTAEEIRLLVTDVVMPGASGRVLAEELRRQRPGVRVLFVTGYSREVLGPEDAAAAGAHFLPKPFTPTSLLARVRQVLDEGEPDA